jgi:hypothetical protein
MTTLQLYITEQDQEFTLPKRLLPQRMLLQNIYASTETKMAFDWQQLGVVCELVDPSSILNTVKDHEPETSEPTEAQFKQLITFPLELSDLEGVLGLGKTAYRHNTQTNFEFKNLMTQTFTCQTFGLNPDGEWKKLEFARHTGHNGGAKKHLLSLQLNFLFPDNHCFS